MSPANSSPQLRPSGSPGFTLVELMVVVAIIGILASIAISNYKKYQARARQTEAKIALAAIYTAEQSFFAMEGTYTHCFQEIGAEFTSGLRRYYEIGNNSSAGNCGPQGTSGANCRAYKWDNAGVATLICPVTPDALASGTIGYGVVPNAAIAGTLPVWTDLPISDGTQMAQTYFIIQAVGHISDSGVMDQWTINESKNLINLQSGI